MREYGFKGSFFHDSDVIHFGIADVTAPGADITSWRFDVLEDDSVVISVTIHLTGTDKIALANNGIDPELFLMRKFTQWYRQGQHSENEIHIQRSDEEQAASRTSDEKKFVRHSVMETVYGFHDEGFLSTTKLQILLSSDSREADIDDALGWLQRRGWIRFYSSIILPPVSVSGPRHKGDVVKEPAIEKPTHASVVDAHDPVFKTAYKLEPSKLVDIEKFLDTSPRTQSPHRHFQAVPLELRPPFVFVIMPFKKDEFPQEIYHDVIKPIVQDDFKKLCFRVDEDWTASNIIDKIYTSILESEFVIAETSTRNPNVLYELGMAHALGKDVIIIENKNYLPECEKTKFVFDIDKFPCRRYTDDNELREMLRRAVFARTEASTRG